LKAKIQALAESEMSRNGKTPLPADAKVKAIADIQKTFYAAKIPQKLMDQLTAQVARLQDDAKREYPNSKLNKIKLRSSANAEDVEDFDGAGLHDSFGASIKKGLGDPKEACSLVAGEDVDTKTDMDPDTVFCALRGVYASLWNKRAVEERSYAHINHLTAGMGIAVNQSYNFRHKTEDVEEIANAVLITRVLAGNGVFGYQMSLNTKDNLVTNPTPGTQSEVVIATFIGDEKPQYTVTQYARPESGKPVNTKSIVTREVYDRLITMAKAVETGYCRAVKGYYPDDCSFVASDADKPKSLDLEFKIFSNGEVLIKQTREFSGH
jgi:hypothetical protein